MKKFFAVIGIILLVLIAIPLTIAGLIWSPFSKVPNVSEPASMDMITSQVIMKSGLSLLTDNPRILVDEEMINGILQDEFSPDPEMLEFQGAWVELKNGKVQVNALIEPLGIKIRPNAILTAEYNEGLTIYLKGVWVGQFPIAPALIRSLLSSQEPIEGFDIESLTFFISEEEILDMIDIDSFVPRAVNIKPDHIEVEISANPQNPAAQAFENTMKSFNEILNDKAVQEEFFEGIENQDFIDRSTELLEQVKSKGLLSITQDEIQEAVSSFEDLPEKDKRILLDRLMKKVDQDMFPLLYEFMFANPGLF
jgi:hypothetical protein